MKKILLTSLGLASAFALVGCNNTSKDAEPTVKGYQITVEYEDGTKAPNVKLQFCNTQGECYTPFVTTDSTGVAVQSSESILAKEGDLVVHVNSGLPSGYTYDPNSVIVNSNTMSGTIVLHELASTEHLSGTLLSPAQLSKTGYYETCLQKGGLACCYIQFSETGTYEFETYGDSTSPSDTYVNLYSGTSLSDITKEGSDNDSGNGKNCKMSLTVSDTSRIYMFALLQQGTPVEDVLTFSILKK